MALKEIQARRPDLDGAILQEEISKTLSQIEKIKTEIQRFPESSPEAFIAISILELRKYKRQLNKNWLIETPYVREKKEEIIEHLKSGRSIFLFGETGTGKTEIAKQIAKEITAKEAEIIYGHRFMTPEEIWGYLGVAPSEKKLEKSEIIKILKEKHNLPPQTAEEIASYYIEILEGKSSWGQVETKFFIGPLAKAIKEGRILIIDEGNYIPPGLLASLNAIIANPLPGKTITLPVSGEEIKIAEGFGIIITGNITFDSIKRYKERYEIDPALKDRVKFIEYNTPTQETYRSKDFKEEGARDLFLIALTELVDNKGNLVLSGGEEGLLKVWRLCQAFKIFQENFARKESPDYKDKLGTECVLALEKNHASMRKLINILRRWKQDGQRYELDFYVWKELIEPSLTEPVEAAYFYQILQNLYDFFQSEGWDKNPDYGEGLKLIKFNPQIPKNPNAAPAKKIISLQIISEAIRGKKIPIEEFASIQEKEINKRIEENKLINIEFIQMKEDYEKEFSEIKKACP